MAANDYFTPTSAPSRDHIYQQDTSPSSIPSIKPPTSLYNNYPPLGTENSSPHPGDSLYDSPHYARDSYYSTASFTGASDDQRQYADDIPLKPAQPIPMSQDDTSGQPDRSSASMEPQRHAERERKPRIKRQGWFTGRITWVVFAASLIQLGVFIGELAISGMYNSLSMRRARFHVFANALQERQAK